MFRRSLPTGKCARLLTPGRARAAIFLALAAAFLVPSGPARGREGWLGVYTQPVDSLPPLPDSLAAMLSGTRCGLVAAAVIPFSPADSGGLLEGDIIVSICGRPLPCPPESASALLRHILSLKQAGEACTLRVIRDALTRSLSIDGAAVPQSQARRFWHSPVGLLDSLPAGSELVAQCQKHRVVTDLPIVLGPRPSARWEPPPPNERIFPRWLFQQTRLQDLVRQVTDAQGVHAETEDLLSRLRRCHEGADPYRLPVMIYVHRDPTRLEPVSRYITRSLASAPNPAEAVARAAKIAAPQISLSLPAGTRLAPPGPDLPPERAAAGVLAQVESVLAEAASWHRQAFRALSQEERSFLESHRWDLSDAFASEVYIHFDEDRDRFARNKRTIDLALKVDYRALAECGQRMALLTDPQWARAAAAIFRRAFAESLQKAVVIEKETPAGAVIIGGIGNDWHRRTDVAFLLDLGGNDFYTGNPAGSNGWSVPLSVCIDAAGNDAYESTTLSVQGSGCLGVGGLLDLEGNDTYIGLQWAQGTGYFGIGWLLDLRGDDTYRGRTFCQGAGLFGIGLLLDGSGNDRYEGDCHVQGVGFARGLGALVDSDGDDHYYAKGLYPTGYGDAGIFDAWSQGCGMGFRTLASGGLGILVDGGGSDRMEAGNFSQGGGYYYGYGILHALGPEGDTYIGSRYNQGFCAHQAVGCFLEDGGDDFYTTRQGVAQGLAWDECVTLFRDRSGNDRYEGGRFFSLGASAHNSFCFFIDERGEDQYLYKPGPARAGGNTYHGGTSCSLFLDLAGKDTYTAEGFGNDAFKVKPEYGFFIDWEASGSLENLLMQMPWRNE